MSDFKSRLFEEKSQLDEKLKKLSDFKDSEKFKEVSVPQRQLLNIQYYAMATYSECLKHRLALLDSVDDGGSNPPGGPGTPP